jgi:DNA-binding transcriptional LysR family regulator
MALANLLECGGAAYIAKSMVRDALAKKKLFQVMDAPVIKRTYYAAYSPNSDKRDTIETVLKSLHSLQSLTK